MYDVAQICLNGHLISSLIRGDPDSFQKHCVICGEATITACPECSIIIRGENIPNEVSWTSHYVIPQFCHNCGKPYPWTSRKIEAAKDLSQELKGLTSKEKALLEQSLDDLVKDTPRSELAAIRFKRIMSKVGKESYELMKTIIIDIITDTARKLIFAS